MHRAAIMFIAVACLTAPAGARAGFVSYTDEAEWRAAASLVGTGVVHEIDFETLPDGSPSVHHTPITPELNYGDQGVIFSPGVSFPPPILPTLNVNGSPGNFRLLLQHR